MLPTITSTSFDLPQRNYLEPPIKTKAAQAVAHHTLMAYLNI